MKLQWRFLQYGEVADDPEKGWMTIVELPVHLQIPASASDSDMFVEIREAPKRTAEEIVERMRRDWREDGGSMSRVDHEYYSKILEGDF